MLATTISPEKNVFLSREQRIYDIFRTLENAADEFGPGAPTPMDTITALFNYMNNELAWEEKVMSNDREVAAHKRAHDNFRSTVMSYISMVQFGISPPTSEVRKFLENWISSHVAAPGAMTLE